MNNMKIHITAELYEALLSDHSKLCFLPLFSSYYMFTRVNTFLLTNDFPLG